MFLRLFYFCFCARDTCKSFPLFFVYIFSNIFLYTIKKRKKKLYVKVHTDAIISGVIHDRGSLRWVPTVISRTVWFGRRWKRLARLWLDEAGVCSSSLSERKEQPGASGSGKWREDEMRQDGTRELGTTNSLSSDEMRRDEGEKRRRDEMRNSNVAMRYCQYTKVHKATLGSVSAPCNNTVHKLSEDDSQYDN